MLSVPGISGKVLTYGPLIKSLETKDQIKTTKVGRNFMNRINVFFPQKEYWETIGLLR